MSFAKYILLKGVVRGGGILLAVFVCFLTVLDLQDYFSSSGGFEFFGPNSWMAMFFENFLITTAMFALGGVLIGYGDYWRSEHE